MTIETGDILRVVATMLWSDGNVMQNVFNAVITGGGGPWTDDDVVDDAEDWMDNVYANITDVVADVVSGSQIIVYKYDSVDDDWDEVGSEVWGWSPTSVGEQAPRGVAALINMKTSDPDVSGKKYIGGMTESGLEDGLWNSSIIAKLILLGVDWGTGFIGAVSLADWAPGVWSVVDSAFYQSGDTIVIPFIPAYQRRRKRGIGI